MVERWEGGGNEQLSGLQPVEIEHRLRPLFLGQLRITPNIPLCNSQTPPDHHRMNNPRVAERSPRSSEQFRSRPLLACRFRHLAAHLCVQVMAFLTEPLGTLQRIPSSRDIRCVRGWQDLVRDDQ